MSEQTAVVRFSYAEGDRSDLPREDITITSTGEIHVLFGRRYGKKPFQKIFSIPPGVTLSKYLPSGKFWVTYCLSLPGNLFGESYKVVRCVCYRRDKYRGFVPCNEIVFEAFVQDYQRAIQMCGRRVLDQLPIELQKELFQGFF